MSSFAKFAALFAALFAASFSQLSHFSQPYSQLSASIASRTNMIASYDERTIDDIMLLAWSRTNGRDVEYMFVSQLPQLLDTIKSMAGINQPLITKEETNLLTTMIRDNPSLKLYKRELPQFLSRLTRKGSLKELFESKVDRKTRFNSNTISEKWELPNVLGDLPNLFGGRNRSTKLERNSLNDTNTRDYHQDTYISPPNSSPNKNGTISNQFGYEYDSYNKNDTYAKNDKFGEKYKYNDKGSAPLSSGFDPVYGSTIRKLEAQCEQYQKSYKALEHLCEEYQQELYKRGSNPRLSPSRISQVILYLPSGIVAPIRNSLAASFKYGTSRTATVTSIVTLIVISTLVVNVFKIIVYATVLLLHTNVDPTTYIYDTYDAVPLRPVWWKEVEWLEYWVYTLEEWMQ